MTSRSFKLFALLAVFVSLPALASDSDWAADPPIVTGWGGELHLGAGLMGVNDTESSGGPGFGLTGQGGLSFGYRLPSGLTPVALFNIGVINNDPGAATFMFFGAGLQFGQWLPFELTAGAGASVLTGIGPTPVGLGVLVRASYLFGSHHLGPYLQVEGDVLNHGISQLTTTLGIQFELF